MTDQTTTTETTYNGQIVEYSPVNAGLAELEQRYGNVIFPVDTKAGMKDAKEVRSKLVKLRTGLEALRKDIKEPALRRTQAIDAEAKAITAAIRNIEEPIDAQIKAEEARIEAEKAAKAALEAEIKEKIAGIRNLPLALAHASAEEIAAEKEALEAFDPPSSVFGVGELYDDCKAALIEAVTALADLHEKAVIREQAAAVVAADQARLTAEREAFEAEKAAYEAEKRAFEAAKATAAAEAAQPALSLADVLDAAAPATIAKALRSDAPSGAENEPEVVDAELPPGWHKDQQTFVMPEITITAEEAAQVFTEAEPEAPVFVAEFHIRQLAMATADQFHALAGKVEQCGFTEFADTLRAAGNHLHAGAYDAALTSADHEALIAADNLMLDATVAAIDALGDEALAA